jgi:predicted signal transduction protein with EAL and GGDEF domain
MNFQNAVLNGPGRLGAIALARWRALGLEWQGFPAEHALAGSFRAEQLQAVLRLTPLTMLANLVNASLICITFWHSTHLWMLAGWMALVLLAVAQGVRAWKRGKSRPTASTRALRRATLHAGVLALIWAAVPLALFHGADTSGQLLISTITAGMICAGGFALATVPIAATAYVLILSAAGV